MKKILSQDGLRGLCELPLRRATRSSHVVRAPRGPSCDEIFTMLEAPIVKIERGSFLAFDLYFHMSYSDLKTHLSRKSYSLSKFGWSGAH